MGLIYVTGRLTNIEERLTKLEEENIDLKNICNLVNTSYTDANYLTSSTTYSKMAE